MRKITVFLLAAIISISFAGCRSNVEVGPTEPSVPDTPPVTMPPVTTTPDTFDDVPNIPDPSVDNDTLQDLIPGEDMPVEK